MASLIQSFSIPKFFSSLTSGTNVPLNQRDAATHDTSITNPPEPSSSAAAAKADRTSRSRKQFLLFAAGSTFVLLSTTITRRALHRRHLATAPSFYQPSNIPPKTPVNGPMEALEALNLATLNVASFMLMMGGGALWALDISSMEDARRMVRGGLGVDGKGRSEQDVEEEFEEWMVSVLKRKDDKEELKKRREKDQDGSGG